MTSTGMDRKTLTATVRGCDPGGAGDLVVRAARKRWPCTCARGRNARPECTRRDIQPGELYVEYRTDAMVAGSRYHAACALAVWPPAP